MKWVLSAFAVIWIVGWIALCSQTLSFQPTLFGKVKGATLLFFIWPIVVIAAANE